jgi:hypothetical protein
VDWLSEGELLAAGAERGCVVSHRQLRRWRATGFVEYTRRRPGRGRGSQTRYPPHAVDQLVAAHHTVRRGRDLNVSLVLAAAYATFDLRVPPPPGFGGALRRWNKFLRAFPVEQAGFDIEQHVRKRGVSGVSGMSRGDLGEAMGLLAERFAGRVDPPDDAGLITLVELTDHLHRKLSSDAETTVSKEFVTDLWAAPATNTAAIEQVTKTATSEDLADALTTAAKWMLQMPWPGRRFHDQVAIVLAALTCKALVERSDPFD